MSILKKSAAVSAAFALLLSGCATQTQSDEQESFVDEESNAVGEENDFDTIGISELRENFDDVCEKIKALDTQNIDFSDAKITFTDADEVSVLALSELSGKTAEEQYEFFFNAVDELMPGKYTDDEKEYEIRFLDGDEVNADSEYPYNCPDKSQYANINEKVSPWLTVDNDDCFIDMLKGCLRCFDNGALVNYDNSDSSPAMYFMIANNHSVVYYTTDMSSEKSFNLINGEISIAEASSFVNDYFSKLKISPYDNIAVPKAVSVKVADLGGGIYGYSFSTAPFYNGIMFDCADMRSSDMSIKMEQNDYDKRDYLSNDGIADMISTDEIHHFINISFTYNIVSTEPKTKIISPDYAATLVSDFFSDSLSLKARSVSAVYLPIPDENQEYTTAVPGWKFLLSSGERFYHVIVNMLTAEIYVYVQIVETGLEYD